MTDHDDRAAGLGPDAPNTEDRRVEHLREKLDSARRSRSDLKRQNRALREAAGQLLAKLERGAGAWSTAKTGNPSETKTRQRLVSNLRDLL